VSLQGAHSSVWTAPATVSFTCPADLAVIVAHCLLSKLDVFSLIALSASAVIVNLVQAL